MLAENWLQLLKSEAIELCPHMNTSTEWTMRLFRGQLGLPFDGTSTKSIAEVQVAYDKERIDRLECPVMKCGTSLDLLHYRTIIGDQMLEDLAVYRDLGPIKTLLECDISQQHAWMSWAFYRATDSSDKTRYQGSTYATSQAMKID